jgi:hypothetical protein
VIRKLVSNPKGVFSLIDVKPEKTTVQISPSTLAKRHRFYLIFEVKINFLFKNALFRGSSPKAPDLKYSDGSGGRG